MFIPRSVTTLTLVVWLSSLSSTTVSGLNTNTHRIINRRAAESSAGFDDYLRRKAGFRAGIETRVRERTIREWIEEGGVREDDWLRFLRHFHDPLKPWDTAGLDFVVARHDSSVRWMQDPNQGDFDTGGFWSWRDARRLYYEALVEPNPARREALWADLFRALGQVMHLVVDASVPEHTRNDMHPLGGLTATSSYEYWVSDQHPTPALEDLFVAKFLSAPIGFAPVILQLPPPPGEHIASVPVSRLIDADIYDGSNPRATVSAVDPRVPVPAGLAEVANANFYSENTLSGGYPSPTDEGLVRIDLAAQSGRVRRYWSRPAATGLLPANPLRAECASEAYGTAPPPYPCMDGVVWNQVAAHMLPRAVGYASGVLDYFFRGAMSVTGVEWTSSGVTIRVRNDGAEEMEGTLEVFARHQPGSPAERRSRLATLAGGAPVLLGPGEQRTFALPVSADGVPSAAHVLVFKGRLGLEAESVAGQVFTVPYVEVRQTSYDADLAPSCARLPPSQVLPPYPRGVTVTILAESMRCEWRVTNHRVSGTLETNTWTDPATGLREPVIERIEAVWVGGDAPGPAPLMVDGQSVGSAWQREGMEPDPVTFAIADATDRGRSYLYLLVSYIQGGHVEAHQAIFTWPASSHGKLIVLDNRISSAPQYLVTSGRAVSGLVAYNWQIDGDMRRPLFEPVTHSGAMVPTDETTERRFGGTRVFREGLRVNAEAYSDNAIDVFETPATEEAAFARYAAIEPLVSPHPNGPVYVPVAEVRRVYQPMEREFMRAFVTADPQSYVVRLAAAND